LPNSHSEQANNDPILFFNYFEKNRVQYDLISVWDHDYNTSSRSKNYQIKYLKKKFKNLKNIKVINYKKTLFEKISRFFLRIFSNKPYYFYGNYNTHKKIFKSLDNFNSKIILNFFELPASVFSKKNNKLKIFNYFGVHRKSAEILRIKNLLNLKRKIPIFKIINAMIYVWKIENLYDNFLIQAQLNFCAAKDTYDKYKKKFRNMYFSGPLSTDRSNIKKREEKIPVVLMIGALSSSFMQDSVSLVANSADQLNEIYKKNKFKLRIVGKGKPSNKNLKKLKYPWVDFAGWVESSQNEYAKASFLFTPNSIAVGPRTKILEAASAKVCIITTKENIINCFPYFKNLEDMVIAKDMSEFCKNFEKVLISKKLTNKLIKCAKEKYDNYYSPNIAIKKNLDLIKKYSK
jgi:hypothetical protein